MKRTLLALTVLIILLSRNLNAQDNEFKILSPENIAGKYGVGLQTSWGPTVKDFNGEVAWAYTAAGDSLSCDVAVNDLTDKVAMVRRGTCSFSLKTYNAQVGGAKAVIVCNNTPADPTATIGMTGLDSVAVITIPAVLVSFATCELIAHEIALGNTVSVNYGPPLTYANFGPYSYTTPKAQIKPLADIQFNVVNREGVDLSNIMTSVDITDPSGSVTTLTTTLGQLAIAADTIVSFNSYTPSEIGEYTMVYKVRVDGHDSYESSDITQHFEISSLTFSQDNMKVTSTSPGAFNQDSYVAGGLTHDWGCVYPITVNTIAAAGTFAINNPDSIPDGEFFSLILYDVDPDGDGVVPAIDYANFSAIAGAGYIWEGTETKNQVLEVPLESLIGDEVELTANHLYLMIVQYNGNATNQTKSPSYTYSGTDDYPLVFDQALKSSQFFSGYVGHLNPITRLILDESTGTSNPSLSGSKCSIFPNPVSDQLNLDMNLDQSQYEMDWFLMDIKGKVVAEQRNQSVVNGVQQIDTKGLSSGTYLLHVRTPEGNTTKKFVIAK